MRSVTHQAGPHGTEATLTEEETAVFKLVEIFGTVGHFNLKWESVDQSKQDEIRALGRLASLDDGTKFGLCRNQSYLNRLHLSSAPWTAVV